MNGINKPLLSICIPTWNRSHFLKKSLLSLKKQIVEIESDKVEVVVSDNFSSDDTINVVSEIRDGGLPITYNRNPENIGAARNFVRCIELARGKYILLLGDDDILREGSLKLIIDHLDNNEYGMVFIHSLHRVYGNIIKYNNSEKFIKDVSFWFTFMSACIFRKDIASTINTEYYINTHLLQMPYFIASSTKFNDNLIINQDLLDDGLDSNNNGGFNLFEVFVSNYLRIWTDFRKQGTISKSLYLYLKRDIFLHFILSHIYEQLLFRINIKSTKNVSFGVTNRKGYDINNSWKILFKNYGGCWYFYIIPFYVIYAFLKYGVPSKSLKDDK